MEPEPLKPCPFCGMPAILEEVESGDEFRWAVYCSNHTYCGGTTSRCRSPRKATEFWNRRFAPTDINLECQVTSQ